MIVLRNGQTKKIIDLEKAYTLRNIYRDRKEDNIWGISFLVGHFIVNKFVGLLNAVNVDIEMDLAIVVAVGRKRTIIL